MKNFMLANVVIYLILLTPKGQAIRFLWSLATKYIPRCDNLALLQRVHDSTKKRKRKYYRIWMTNILNMFNTNVTIFTTKAKVSDSKTGL